MFLNKERGITKVEVAEAGKGNMEAIYSMRMAELIKSITCEVTLTGVMTSKVRLAAGCLLFKFAAWVAGMKGKVTVGDKTLGEIR